MSDAGTELRWPPAYDWAPATGDGEGGGIKPPPTVITPDAPAWSLCEQSISALPPQDLREPRQPLPPGTRKVGYLWKRGARNAARADNLVGSECDASI